MKSRNFGFSQCPIREKAVGAQGGERSESGQLDQASQGDVPHHISSCLTIKLGESAGGCRSPGTGWASVSKWQAITACITCFNIFFSSASPFLIKLCFNPQGLTFLFSVLSYDLEGRQANGCAVLSCLPG